MTIRTSCLWLAMFSFVGVLPLPAAPSLNTLVPEQNTTVPSLDTIRVTFSEPVTGVDAADLLVNASSAVTVSGSGAGPYEFRFTQPVPGEVSVSWDGDHGIAGTEGTGAYEPEEGWFYMLLDTVSPTIGEITSNGGSLKAVVPAPGAEVDTMTQAEVFFSEVVLGVEAADLLLNGVAADSVAGEGAGPYIFTFADAQTGALAFTWAADHGIEDPAGNVFDGEGWEATLAPGQRGNVIITEFMAANADGLRDLDDDASDWLELHNPGDAPVNLAGWTLSVDPGRPDMWVFPSKSLPAGGRLVVFASGKDIKSIFGALHTNFNLGLSGGYLALHGPESPRRVVSSFEVYPEQRYDVSYGLTSSGEAVYFPEPTPEQANAETGLVEITPEPTASVGRGFFAEPFELLMSSEDPSAEIRYTLDGSEPLASSPVFPGRLTIEATTVLCAAAYAPDKVHSAAVTHSYIFLDQVLQQPEPPYDNPERDDDNDYPPLPQVGGATFPISWGSQSGAGFPGEIDNLNNNQAPADYGMDREIIDDPDRYNDDGEIDPENGLTNRERIDRALRELPLMSIVMNNDDMFGPDGLHPNSLQKGTRFEKPCSVELLLPDGTTGFATTCGIRMHGNASREPRKCPKHGFKLNFRSIFGASKLTYPLFPDSPASEFDDIILRGDFNSSWVHWSGSEQRPRGTRMRDAFCKDTFRDMGRAAGHHRYVHLFINGLYWGLYDPTEQENADFAANTFGGSKDDYDVVEQGQLKSGTSDAYDAMRAIAAPIDNARYEEMKTYVDVPWLIDYMLLHFFLGHQDWGDDVNKNWYTVRHRDGGRFKYLPWDMENLMWSEDVNRVGVSSPPSGLHTKLVTNDQYLLDFADRVHEHLMMPDGALTPANNIARWRKWRGVIQNAIACESARWGDYRRDVHRHESGPYVLFTWNEHWIEENNRLTEVWFPQRPEIVLGQLRARGLYPSVNATQFKDAEGRVIGSRRVSPGFQLSMVLPSIFSGGDIYYTTDGSDPHVTYDTSGQPSLTAVAYDGPLTIDEPTVVKARVLREGEWSALTEATFSMGVPAPAVRITEIHYRPRAALGGSAAEFVELQNTGDLAVDMSGWSFGGIEFVVPWQTVLGPGDRMVIASNDAPNIFAAQHPGVVPLGYFKGALNNGGERLTLRDRFGNSVSTVEFNDADPWARAADGGGSSLEIMDVRGDGQSPFNWKASDEPNGSPGRENSPPATPSARISEFHRDFVEIRNQGDTSVDVTGWRVRIIDEGRGQVPELAPATEGLLPPDGTAIFSADDGLPLVVAGGEIALVDSEGVVVDGVRYGPQSSDYSFARIEGSWQLALPTPGDANETVSTGNLADLRLNEWLADPPPGEDDWLELVNLNAELPVVLEGLHFGRNDELIAYAAPAVVAPGGFLRLYADRGSPRADTIQTQLPAAGATLTLRDTEGDLIDTIVYGMQRPNFSEGRLPDGTGAPMELEFASPGLANHIVPANGPVINEVLLINHRGENSPRAGRPGWVEIRNPSAEAVEVILRTDGCSGGPVWQGSVAADAYQTVWMDELCALDDSYRHWGVELLDASGHVIDRINWGYQIPDSSIGRLGDGSWALLRTASRGGPNGQPAPLGAVENLRLNEWFAAGGGSLLDSYVEIYSAGDRPIHLGGRWLSDEPSEVGRRKWQIPERSFVAPGERVWFYSGSGTSNPTRFLFDLARGGEYLRLGENDEAATLISGFSYARSEDSAASQGFLPDGEGEAGLLKPTPGAPNTDAPGPVIARHPSTQAAPAAGTVTFIVGSPDAESFSWLHDGVVMPDESSPTLTLDDLSLVDEGRYVCVVTNASGSTMSREATLTVLYTFDSWAAENGVTDLWADDDTDGLANFDEFVRGTDPTQPLGQAEVESVRGTVDFESGPSGDYLIYESGLNPRAVYSNLAGELSPDLRDPWSPRAPSGRENLGETAIGSERVRLWFAVPSEASRQFLRLRFEP